MQKTNEISPLARVECKGTALIVWQIASESGHLYNVSLYNHKVTGCERSDGQPCKSWYYRRSCHHAELAQAREDVYQMKTRFERNAREDAMMAELTAQAAPIAERGKLNGTREVRRERGIPMR